MPASNSAVATNRFSSIFSKPTSTATWGYRGNSFYSRIAITGDDTSRRVNDRYLAENGYSNKPFDTSTTGAITPNQTYGNDPDPRITRGFIRRSAPDSGDSISLASLNFMFNPETIVREYVSYLDQAALDPFNTLYDSGNLVNPPSFVNFSFDLLFDRQIENAAGDIPEGVLHDYKYFDMVVRNVPASSAGSSQVPDNGVMMVNPKDITVVFSPQLTVQGRPTNARVAFTKFDHNMTPIRMVVSLTMIITYFGPLREAFGYDTNQEIAEYEALVPYSSIYDETYTEEDLADAQKLWKESRDERYTQSVSAPKDTPYSTLIVNKAISSAYTQGGGAAAINGAVGGDVRFRAVLRAYHRAQVAEGYSQAKRLQHPGPTTDLVNGGFYDCSSFVCRCYSDIGANYLITGDEATIGWTGSIQQHQESTGWTGLSKVLDGNISASTLQQNAQIGDILFGGGHIAFVGTVTSTGLDMVHARNSSKGVRIDTNVSFSSVASGWSYTHLLRANAAGSLSSGASFA